MPLLVESGRRRVPAMRSKCLTLSSTWPSCSLTYCWVLAIFGVRLRFPNEALVSVVSRSMVVGRLALLRVFIREILSEGLELIHVTQGVLIVNKARLCLWRTVGLHRRLERGRVSWRKHVPPERETVGLVSMLRCALLVSKVSTSTKAFLKNQYQLALSTPYEFDITERLWLLQRNRYLAPDTIWKFWVLNLEIS